MNSKSKMYKIKGMHCASCISSVEKLIVNTNGVDSAVANLALEKVKINYNDVIPINEIKEKLELNGFQLIDELIENSNEDNKLSKNNQKLLLISILGSILFIYSMGSMLYNLESNWDSVLIQFSLASPIIILCRSIYINGFQSIKNKRPNMNSLVAIGTLSAYIYSVISSMNILFNLEINAFEKIYFGKKIFLFKEFDIDG